MGAATPILTPILPAGTSYLNFLAAAPLLVKMEAIFPNGLRDSVSIPSSRDFA